MPWRSAGIVFFMLFTSLLVEAQSGIIKGKVSDAQTAQPLPFASVYVNYTTIGTYANDKGEFLLKNLPPGSYDIVVSYIGHKPYQAHINLSDSAEIFLSVKLELTALREVQITAKRDRNWDKQLEKFKRLFLDRVLEQNFVKS